MSRTLILTSSFMSLKWSKLTPPLSLPEPFRPSVTLAWWIVTPLGDSSKPPSTPYRTWVYMILPANPFRRPSFELISSRSSGPLTSAVIEMLPSRSDIMLERKGVRMTACRLSMTAVAAIVLSLVFMSPAMSITFLSASMFTRENPIFSACSSHVALTARSPTRLPDSSTESAFRSAEIS